MGLTGITPFNNADREKFESLTENYIELYYNNHNNADIQKLQNFLHNVSVAIKVTSMDPPYVAPSSRLRRLVEQSPELEVTFDQDIFYQLNDGFDMNATLPNIVKDPFNDIAKRKDYVQHLQVEFESIERSSLPIIPTATEDKGGEKDYIKILAVVGPVVAGLIILFVIGLVYFRRKQKPDNLPSSIFQSNRDEDTIPTHPEGGIMSDQSLIEFGAQENSIGGTVDPDYNPNGAHGSTNGTISSAGGTLGTFGHGGYSATESILTPALNSAGQSIFSNDDQSFEQHLHPSPLKEDIFDVIAPPGKLGVVIDTPDSGAPVVYNIKENCPIADQLRVGDKVVAVDGEDVRSMTAIKVSRLISEKSTNPERVFRIIRCHAL